MLLESRHSKPPEKEPLGAGGRGRPRLNVATTSTSMALSKGDREAIEFWKERLTTLLDRQVSMGETVGFLARVCQERLTALGEDFPAPENLQEMVLIFLMLTFLQTVFCWEILIFVNNI